MKHSKLIKLLFILTLTITLLLPLTNPTTVEAANVKLNKRHITLYKGSSYKLKMKGTTKKIKWKSKDKSIATVSKTGKVKAKKAGTTYIYAIIKKKIYECKVKVKEKKKNVPTYNTVSNDNSNEIIPNDKSISYDKGLTFEMFNQIQTGMTYQEVCNILGSSGKLDIQSESGGYKLEYYTWSRTGTYTYKVIVVGFENGKVIAKSQAGL